jgi:hypothetical protein
MFNKLPVSSLVLSVALFVIATARPIAAQPQFDESQSCRMGIAAAKFRLGKVKTLKIARFETSNLAQRYPDHPKNASMQVLIAIRGTAAENVMNSPKLLTAVSQMITDRCKSVGLVSIYVFETDYGREFGVMDNHRIAEFQCLPEDADPSRPQPSRWGYRICL